MVEVIILKKKETLKDGTGILIRTLTFNDLEQLMAFFLSLPYEDRKYLKIDVTDKSAVEKRIKDVECGIAVRIIALHKNNIIAIGTLELGADDWHKSMGELRVAVSRDFQRKGLGLMMLRELYLIAVDHKVEKIVVKMLRPQIAARKICKKLGFREELLLPAYVKDQDKKDQDLLIMTGNIDELWREFETIYKDSDWQRCR
jgi:RimJ/RimL family protein N-acetyltransferase